MPTTVEVPGVGEIEFPDSMNMDQINAALRSQYGQKEEPAQKPPEQPAQPQFADTTPQAGNFLKQPDRTLPAGEQLTTYGGPPKPVASYEETMVAAGEEAEGAGKLILPQATPTAPRITLPEAKINETDSVLGVVGKESWNLLKSVPEFMTSDVGLGTLFAGASGKAAQTLISGIFTADLFNSLGEQVKSNYENWDKMTRNQKVKALVDLFGTGLFAGTVAKHFQKGISKPSLEVDPKFVKSEEERAILKEAFSEVQKDKEEAKTAEEKGKPDAVQEQKSEQEVLRDKGIRGEGELSGVGAEDQIRRSAEQKAETIAEDNRPAVRVFPEEGGEAQIFPAARKDDGTWETHQEIINRNKLAPDTIDRRIFVDKEGNEKSREEAATQSGIKTEREEDRLHSTDVNREISKARAPLAEDNTASESHIIDLGKKNGAETFFEEDPPAERNTGRIAYADHKNNRITLNRYELRDWLEKVPVDERPKALDSLFNEELIHLRTPPWVARAYWYGLSWVERKLVQRRYTGNWAGERIGNEGQVLGKFTPEQLGWEAINGRIQRMMRLTPREVVEAVGAEQWKVKQLLMMENLIGSLREKFPWNSNQRVMLDKVMGNIQLAKRVASGDFSLPVDSPKEEGVPLPENRYEPESPWSYRKQETDTERLTSLLDAYKSFWTDLKKKFGTIEAADVRDLMDSYAALGKDTNNQYYRDLFKELDPKSVRKLEEFWDKYPDERIRMASDRLDKAVSNLQSVKERIEDPSYNAMSGEALSLMEIENERLAIEALMGIDRLEKNLPQVFPEAYRKTDPAEAYNKRRKAAEEATASLGLMWGKKTPEGFVAEKEVRPTGAELGLPSYQARTEEIVNKMREILESPVKIGTKVAKTAEGATQKEKFESVRTKVERPKFSDFSKWLKKKDERLPHDKARELWISGVWDHLVNAPASRLVDLARAFKLGSFEDLEGAKLKHVAEPSIETGATKVDPKTGAVIPPEPVKKPTKVMETLDLGLQIVNKIPETLPPEKIAEQLMSEADRLDKKAEFFDTLPRQQQITMREELGIEAGKEAVKRGTKEDRMSPEELRDLAEGLRAKAEFLLKGEDVKISPQRLRVALMGEIGRRLINEASPRGDTLSRSDVSVDDIGWGNPNAKVSPYRGIRKKEAYRKDGSFNEEEMSKILLDEARTVESDPVSVTKRLVVLEDQNTGNVVVSSVFKEKGLIRVVEPTGATGTTRGIYVPLESIAGRWKPIWSVLLEDPVQGFRKAFSNRQEYLDAFGTEASRMKESEENPFKGSAPDEVKEQAAADEQGLVKEDLDAATTMMTGGMIRDFKDLPEGRLEEFSEYLQDHGIQWGEGAVTGAGPGSALARIQMNVSRGQIEKAMLPITSAEAMSILHLATDELALGEIKSKAEMSKLLSELQYLAEAGELKPKHWMAISALRKAAREIYRRERAITRQLVDSELERAKKEGRKPVMPEPFTKEDAYRAAFTEFYEIIQSSESQAQYISQVMGRFARPIREPRGITIPPGDWKKAAAERTDLMERRARQFRDQQKLAEWLKSRQPFSTYEGKKTPKRLPPLTLREIKQPEAVERTLMRPDLIPNTTPYWVEWSNRVRKGLAKSQDSYESWLARRSPVIDPPMPRGALRHNAVGDPEAVKLTTPEIDYVEKKAAELHPYQPERLAIDPMQYPKSETQKARERAATIRNLYQLGDKPSEVDTELSYGMKGMESKPDTFSNPQDASKIITDKDLSSPEAFRKKTAESEASRARAKKEWGDSILRFKVKADKFWESMKDFGAFGLGAVSHARSRRVIIEEIYAMRDAMQNKADRQAWEAGRSIFVASHGKLEPLLEGAKITRAERKAHRERAKQVRRSVLSIVDAQYKLRDPETKKVMMVEVPIGTSGATEVRPVIRISRDRIKKQISLAQIAQEKARNLMQSKGFRERRIGKRWLKAATEMQKDAEFALSEYENSLGKRGADGKPMWDSHPLKLATDAFNSEMHDSLNKQIENGIMVSEKENYIPGRHEADVFNNGLFYFGPTGMLGMERRKPKVFSSPFHAIASSHGPFIPRSMDAADLATNSIKQANRLIERSLWAEPLKGVKDTVTGKRIVMDPKYIVRTRSVMDPSTGAPVEVKDFLPTAPELGYEIVRLGDTPTAPAIAVLDVYSKAIKTAMSPGLDTKIPVVGEALVLSGILKHGILLTWDTFHPFRLAQYATAAVSTFNPLRREFYGIGGKGKNPFNPEFWDLLVDYRGGYTALNFRAADLPRAVEAGLISKSSADWALGHVTVRSLVRGPTEGGFKKIMKEQVMTRQDIAKWMTDSVGLNAFRLTDALYRNAIQNIPVIGEKWNDMLEPANKFIFDKVTTGLMVETAVRNFERLNERNTNKSSYEIAKAVVKDVNIIFGNMGRQGIFKNAKFRDIASIFILAPMWREGLIQKDLRFGARGVKAIGKSFAKGVLGAYKDTPWSEVTEMGVLGRTYVKGLLGYFILAQVMNLVSRQKFTWDNDEKGRELDAWVNTGNGTGYWVSTMSVFGEVAHQFLKLAEKKQTYVEALEQMGSNALGPVGRAFMAFFTGKNEYGEKATTSAGWVRNVVDELAVIPITLAAPLKAVGHVIAPSLVPPLRPGEGWQRTVGLVGVKAELPQRYQTQVQEIVKSFMEDNDIPTQPFDMVMTDQPAANKIRRAIYVGDDARVKRVFKGYVEAYMKRHQGSSQIDAVDALNKTMDAHANAPWTKSKKLDELFIMQLKPHQLNILMAAEIERQRELNLYKQMLPGLIRELR